MGTAVEGEQRSSPAMAPVFVGRHAETSALRDALSEAESGSGLTVLITGPGGIGKTTLLRWLEDVANVRKLGVKWGYCLPEVRDPFFPLEQIFHTEGIDELRRKGSEERSSPEGLPLAFLPKSRARADPKGVAVAFVPIAKSIEGRRSSSVARVPSNILLDYLSKVEKEAQEHPCVIFLDDFQWADPDSVHALSFLSRNVKRLPVLIAVTLREDDVQDRSFQEVLSEMRRNGLVKDIPLEGLKEKEILQLLESTVAAPMDTERAMAAVHFLMELTGGNPFFLKEVVRQWQEMGLIRREGQKVVIHVPATRSPRGIESRVPESVSELLTKRLDSLSKDERSILEIAAIVGQEFEAAPLEQLFRSNGEGAGELLRRLSTKRGLIVQKEDGGTKYAFAHALLWETVRDSTPEDRRKQLAGKLAKWWVDHLPADVERTVELYEAEGLNTEAIACVEKVITLALQMHAHERVARYFEKGLALMEQEGASPTKMAEWGLSVVDRLQSDGVDGRWSNMIVQRLLKTNPPEPLSWELIIRLANSSAVGTREGRKLVDKLYEATRQRPELASKALLGRLAAVNARILYPEGKSSSSIECAKQALSLLPEEDRLFRGVAYFRLGWTYMDENRWDEAESNLEKGLTLAKEGRTYYMLLQALNLKGTIANLRGDLKVAEQCYAQAAAICKALGQVGSLPIFLTNLAVSRKQMGNLAGAEEAVIEALRVAEAFGRPRAQGYATHVMGDILIVRKSPQQAMEFLQKAEVIYREQEDVEFAMDLELDMAEVKGAMGDPSGALTYLAKIKDETNLKQDQVPRLHLLRARFAIDTEAKEAGRAELDKALEESRRRGLRYWEGSSLLMLSEWEEKYGSPENAGKAREDAERKLKECGVVDEPPSATPGK
jgi:tetratricopeptide (TPR) repeat protein/energy-coupling factor transporter ATP-binding protein EcfA2